jgi:hypothetical protein
VKSKVKAKGLEHGSSGGVLKLDALGSIPSITNDLNI